MSAVTIREVPDPVLARIKRKAALSGRSLQAYLLDLVSRDAEKESMPELMARLEREASVSMTNSELLAIIDAGREGR